MTTRNKVDTCLSFSNHNKLIMDQKLIILFFISTFLQVFTAFHINRLNLPPKGKIWALLAAGSYTYNNYRHQADVCHAYHVLSSHGIPDEQIVVMMYDDIAQHNQNPTKGVIINHPNGHNVYKNVLKDYTKLDVTPENFLNVLQGNSEEMKNIGSGKVINSGPNDHVFIYFADHGSIGLVSFPNGELYARQLNDVIKNMHKHNKFAKMVLYVEACESGSMFADLLPDNINVFATTAANRNESSFACYWDDLRQTFLGDLYSVTWMEDSDKLSFTQETLKKQFKLVEINTKTSHVQEYGDLRIGNMKLSEFQGENPNSHSMDYMYKPTFDAIASHEVPPMILKRKMQMSNSFEEERENRKELIKLLRNRDYLLDKIKAIAIKSTFTLEQVDAILNERFQLIEFDCYEEAVKYFSKNCFSLSSNSYALKHLHIFVNMCETGIRAKKIIEVMDAVCVHPPIYGIV